VLVELLAAAKIALCMQAAALAEVVVVAAPVVVVVAAVVGVVVGGAVDVAVLADWLLGLLLEQPASTAAPSRTAITAPVALVMRSSVPEQVPSSVFLLTRPKPNFPAAPAPIGGEEGPTTRPARLQGTGLNEAILDGRRPIDPNCEIPGRNSESG
jgi:hypothetical protein